jgi:hypothetical protein
MDAAHFEQHFSWLKTYAHELREAAQTLEEEGDIYKARAVRVLREKGPHEARTALEAVGRTIDAIKGKVRELDDAYRTIIRELSA